MQYCELFPEKLDYLIGQNKRAFYDKLDNMGVDKLNKILENIRFELSIKANLPNVVGMTKNVVSGIEVGSQFIGMDMSGLTDDLFNPQSDFEQNLKLLACEIDFSDVLSPGKMIAFSFVRTAYMRYELNKRKAPDRGASSALDQCPPTTQPHIEFIQKDNPTTVFVSPPDEIISNKNVLSSSFYSNYKDI
jgi:hypothetical protein